MPHSFVSTIGIYTVYKCKKSDNCEIDNLSLHDYYANQIFYFLFQMATSFVDLLCVFFCLVFAMPLCASVYMCLAVTCWERADLLALVCGV